MKKRNILLSAVCFIVIFSVVLSIVVLVSNVKYARAAEELTSQEMININTAAKEELMLLKRIGPALSDRIIAYRELNGPFAKPEDILKVKGLGPKFWEVNKDVITVGKEVEAVTGKTD